MMPYLCLGNSPEAKDTNWSSLKNRPISPFPQVEEGDCSRNRLKTALLAPLSPRSDFYRLRDSMP